MKAASSFVFMFALFALTMGVLFATNSANAATTDIENVTSNVTVNKQVAIDLSTNLSAGILFGSLDPGDTDQNATGNFNATSDMTQYWVEVSTTTNTNIDVCIKANESMNGPGSNTIELGNYTWDDDTTNNATNPDDPATTAMTTSYAYIDSANDTSSGVFYLRFHLDIAAGQAAGDYTNEINIKATGNDTAC